MERNSATGLAGLMGLVLALVIGLHQTGGVAGLAVDWADPIGWVRGSPPELVIGGFVRQLGLILGYWVLASTTAYALARITNRPMRLVRFATLPLARRLVDRAVATSLTLSLLGSPLAASGTEPSIAFEAAGDGIPVPHVRVIEHPTVEPTDTPAEVEVIARPGIEPPQYVAEMASPPVGSVYSAETYVVMTGDNLWTIAAAHLEDKAGGPNDPGCITAYWRKVIEANRKTLRSGDPNLIYPGEAISLPPVGPTP